MASRFTSIALIFTGFLIALSGLYIYKSMSLLMPCFACITCWHYGTQPRNVRSFLHPSLPFLLLFLLIGWGGVSALLTPLPHLFYKDIITSGLSFLFSYVLINSIGQTSESFRKHIRHLLAISIVFLICLMAFQLILDGFRIFALNRFRDAPYMMKPSGSILGLFLFLAPAYLWTYHKRALAVFSFCVMSCLIVLTQCQTAMYGIIIAILVFPCSLLFPRISTSLMMLSSFFTLLVVPLFHLYVIPLSFMQHLHWVQINRSFYHRLLGWDFLVTKFLESPLTGWGFGSSRFLPTTTYLEPGFPHLVHPHNGSLQTYVELGVPGGILYALFCASLFWLIRQHVKDKLSVAVCNATLIFSLVQAQVTQNLWHNYWLSWLAIASTILLTFLQDRAALRTVEAGR